MPSGTDSASQMRIAVSILRRRAQIIRQPLDRRLMLRYHRRRDCSAHRRRQRGEMLLAKRAPVMLDIIEILRRDAHQPGYVGLGEAGRLAGTP